MEVNTAGYYVIPRYLGWEEFLIHIRDVLACGNKMLVQFSMKEGPIMVTDFQKENGLDLDNAWLFTVSGVGHTHTLIEDITNFKFIQFRPNTEWVAIHMGSTKRLGVNEFNEFRIIETFQHLHPVIFLRAGYFWNVMGMEPTDAEVNGNKVWYLYLKRQDKDFMIRVDFSGDQKFIFNPLSDSWSLDNPTEEITDLEGIKKALKSDEVSEVIVSGVPMRLVRVQEIAKGVLFFVFLDTSEKRRYYYARRTTKLRIVENTENGNKEYLLDHIKAMHID